MNALICPKCGSDMRAYERNGVTIDQCTGCRGIFLDRGELERLTDAEAAFYGTPVPAPAPAPSRYPQEDRRDDRYRGDRDDYYKKKKRGSFLGELFD
ncbi:zf-TFIIB domain-containing protein [uncultured Cellulomonas sp.]|uniref:TFIIB-type zinc ribbon-containing protein n=1 Tax=uncultured Cellulomonas sp. TaxID=189682 RepID=UPI0028EA6081|nr:zf-TFIIB domain-containing protein [uncultured Cellulomonas sp.]